MSEAFSYGTSSITLTSDSQHTIAARRTNPNIASIIGLALLASRASNSLHDICSTMHLILPASRGARSMLRVLLITSRLFSSDSPSGAGSDLLELE